MHNAHKMLGYIIKYFTLIKLSDFSVLPILNALNTAVNWDLQLLTKVHFLKFKIRF